MNGDKKTFQIAIDGPVAAGKGTISRLVAERLGFLYVDTGATYRVATLIAMREEFSFEDLDRQNGAVVERLVDKLKDSEIMLSKPSEGELDGRLITVIVDGKDVSWDIREEKVSRNVPIVAKIPEVREVLVWVQQKIAMAQNVVMEGRDITYRVLPDAQIKIYLDADVNERARRRYEQLLHQGKQSDFDEVKKDLEERDRVDRERKTDPLKIVPEAWHLDTSNLSIEEVVEIIVSKANNEFGMGV